MRMEDRTRRGKARRGKTRREKTRRGKARRGKAGGIWTRGAVMAGVALTIGGLLPAFSQVLVAQPEQARGAIGVANLEPVAPGTAHPGPEAVDPADLEPSILYGDSVAIGEAMIRTWIEMDDDGVPLALGVTLPERVFEALTDEGLMLSLDYPEMEGLPFRHVLFDWVPHGHPPAPLYGHAHWDAHFYTITAEERRSIDGGAVDQTPDPRYMPAGYIPVPDLGLFSFPEMGVHWMASDADELHGHTFDQTLIYGSIGEKTIFVEPMFTMAYLETKPDLSAPVPRPGSVGESGYYATRYVIRHLPEEEAFRIALEGFRWRAAD